MYHKVLAVSAMRGVSLASLTGPRDFGSVKQHAADSQHGQHGYGQNDNPHAAQPLQELAVEQHGVRQGVEVAQYRGAGGREPGERTRRRRW